MQTTTPEITRERVERGLETSQKFLERSILAIYERQTADEKSAEETLHHNGVGFNGVDAPFMTRMAEWIIVGGSKYRQPLGRRLKGGQIAKSRKIMRKYAGQLVRIAEEVSSPAPAQPELLTEADGDGAPLAPAPKYSARTLLVAREFEKVAKEDPDKVINVYEGIVAQAQDRLDTIDAAIGKARQIGEEFDGYVEERQQWVEVLEDRKAEFAAILDLYM